MFLIEAPQTRFLTKLLEPQTTSNLTVPQSPDQSNSFFHRLIYTEKSEIYLSVIYVHRQCAGRA